ncbi:FAD-dependent monooxygenase [Kutzneria sp. CA-103260]|uniref:FAD-dependent monooxygenase n=1 Tax=Kutzneria sp. CA-103260 TaxID=2802641 RepID=UPI001BACE288|nr:3-(3-hydroxy-phenyl)propionate/3-hydroxycinnamic acid hydroxylase [Kutzneria sp. CA-103260]
MAVGQSLARVVGQCGWCTLVLEKQDTIYPLPRACHLDHEAMYIFQAMGVADEVAEVTVPVREYRLFGRDGRLLASLPHQWNILWGSVSHRCRWQPITQHFVGSWDAAPA